MYFYTKKVFAYQSIAPPTMNPVERSQIQEVYLFMGHRTALYIYR